MLFRSQKTIENRYPNANKELTSKFYEIYLGMKDAKETGKDSIWKFILQNTYKPFFLKNKFDYIIGNPPWFTYSSIKNAEYQAMLKALADRYNVTPEKKANMPHLEIAAIFMSHCSKYLLRQNGRLAFVLPRSFLSAEHHDNTRSGKSAGFALTEIWDLDDVQPLFNVPSCVLFAQTALKRTEPGTAGLTGRSYKGRPRQHNATYAAVQDRVSFVENRWFYTKLQQASAYTTNADAGGASGENFYKKHFRQGATIVPRNFYFIDIEGAAPKDWHDREISVRSSEANEKDGKEPWKSLKLSGRINTKYLFRTAIAKNILPFGMVAPPLVVLPIEIERKAHHKGGGFYVQTPKILTPEKIEEKGDLETAKWFREVEKIWNKHKTENNTKITSWDYLNWQNKLTEQNIDKKFIVLYSASSTDANSFVTQQGILDLTFISESKGYSFYTNIANEAYFLCSFLNSNTPNLIIKDFQTKGLFGFRDIHKRILDVPLPKYDEGNEVHVKIAEMGKKCSEVVRGYIKTANLATKEYNVGKERSLIRKLLFEELKTIDGLLLEVM